MRQRLTVKNRAVLWVCSSFLLLVSLTAVGWCGLEAMVNFGLNVPAGELADKDKGLGLVGGGLGGGLLYDFGGGIALCGNFSYRHFGLDLLSDSLEGSWRVLTLTGGLRLSRGRLGPYRPYLELGGGNFWPRLTVSTPSFDSTISYKSSLGFYGGLGLKSAPRGAVTYEFAIRLYRFSIEEGELAPQYELFVASPSEIGGKFYYLTVGAVVRFDIPLHL
jgi:hypothetical protein